jgi:hypothetical protein
LEGRSRQSSSTKGQDGATPEQARFLRTDEAYTQSRRRVRKLLFPLLHLV